jgi:hypothetical protein
MRWKFWKRAPVPYVYIPLQISLNLEYDEAGDDFVMIRAQWPPHEDFDDERFLDMAFLLGADRQEILNLIIQAIGRYGQKNEDMGTANYLIDEMKKRYARIKNYQKEKAVDGKKTPLIKPSEVHKYHWLTNNKGGED